MPGRSLIRDVTGLFNKAPIPQAGGVRRSIFSTARNSSTAQLEAYGQVSTLFSVVSAITTACSEPDWHLYRKKVDQRRVMAPREGDRTEVAVHPALDLWNKPNPFYTQSQFIEAVQQHYELAGEMWWIVAKLGGTKIPGELWPIRPDKMEPVPDADEYLKGYLYTGPGGEKVGLGLDEVIFLKAPNPLDPYRGLSPVASLMLDLEGEVAAREWNRNFFRNDATPGGSIEVPDTLGDKEFDRLNSQWEENHRGTGNAHRVVILEKGAKFVGSQFNMRDMQFADLRALASAKIQEAYRVHDHILGKAGDVNRANAEAAEYTFSKWLVRVRLERIKQALNGHLLPMYGGLSSPVEFDFDDPTTEDVATETARTASNTSSAVNLIGAGFDPEDTLEAFGLPKIKFIGKAAPPAPFAPAPEPQLEESVA